MDAPRLIALEENSVAYSRDACHNSLSKPAYLPRNHNFTGNRYSSRQARITSAEAASNEQNTVIQEVHIEREKEREREREREKKGKAFARDPFARDRGIRIQLASQVLHKLAINATRTIPAAAQIERNTGRPIKNSLPALSRGSLETVAAVAAAACIKECRQRLGDGAMRANVGMSEQSLAVMIMRQLQGIYSSSPRTNIQFN